MKREFRDFLKENFPSDVIRLIDVEAKNEAKAILRSQELATLFITSLMEEQNIGFNEFARKTQVSPSHLSAILRGKSSPTLTTLARIAATFGKCIKVSQG